MSKENNPFFSDEFLDELAEEINKQNGDYPNEHNVESLNFYKSIKNN